MGLCTCTMNKQKYNNNISIKKKWGLRSKQATPNCSIKKEWLKQINRQQQHCKQLVYIYRDFAKAKTLFQVQSLDCLAAI